MPARFGSVIQSTCCSARRNNSASIGIAGLDYLLGSVIRLIVLYALPIGLTRRQHGRGLGLLLAAALPLFRSPHYLHTWELPLDPTASAVNAFLHTLGFVGVVLLVDRMAAQAKRIRVLGDFIRVCMFCKRAGDDQQQWKPLERYISERTNSTFSHGICPACAEREYGYVE